MFDVGSWGEFLIITVVALLVIDPKDIPKVLKTVGCLAGKFRKFTASFQAGIREAIRQGEQEDLKKALDELHKPIDLNHARKHKPHEKS